MHFTFGYYSVMYTSINETINVFANFTNKGAEPLCFTWKNNDYKVTQINFIHKSKKGDHPIYHFAVTANNETYKLTFDPNLLEWKLDEIYLEKDYQTAKSLNQRQNAL